MSTLPTPPCYAAIFTSPRARTDAEGHEGLVHRMVELAAGQPGYLGRDSARGDDGGKAPQA